MTKQLVTRSKSIRNLLDCNTIPEAIAQLQKLQEENPDYKIDIGTGEEYGDTYCYVNVTWEELETDKEYEKRLKQEAEAKKYRKKYYEMMKKEFGEA